MKGQRIGIVGLARSGRAAAALALARGAQVFASDASDSPDVRAAAQAIERDGGKVETGGHTAAELAQCDLLVVSPGIPPRAEVFCEVGVRDVPRISELEFAYRYLESPVIAVTGTNGKSTTTAWIAHLLRESGADAVAAGNIGLALSEVALRPRAPDWVIVEASSFQLADVDTFAPRLGVVTNLSPDHLDRYPSVEAYYADKANLFRNAKPDSVWVLNGEDDETRALPGSAVGERRYFRVRTPPPAGEQGAYVRDDGMLVLNDDDGVRELVAAEELPLLGEHNRANALASALAAAGAGVRVEALRAGLRTFRPLPHRLEPVASVDGVLWINDSKATNVASTLVALKSMERPTILLLGGRHKGEPYTALLPALSGVRVVIAFGEAAAIVQAELEDATTVVRTDGGFDDVVELARRVAVPGDAVLLSPACSSYDMFANYEERGGRFAELARKSGGEKWRAR